jgi:quercetin dioxygenase-like cupin family protein
MTQSDDDGERLRERPSDRFAEPERLVNLEEEARKLRGEPHEPIEGHRQITIAKRKGFSLLLFDFESGATLPDHEVDGEVTIHVLDGELHIDTDSNQHEVEAGEILILAPRVTHDVEAPVESRMLLTVELDGEDDESNA